MIFSSRSLIKITILIIAIWVMPATPFDLKGAREECKTLLSVIFNLDENYKRENFWDTNFFKNPNNYKHIILTAFKNMTTYYFQSITSGNDVSNKKLKTNMIIIAKEYLEFVNNIANDERFSKSSLLSSQSDFNKDKSLTSFCNKKITDNDSILQFAENLIKQNI